jgi:hypothetical protein
MRILTWRGWLLVLVIGSCSAALTFWGLFTIRRLLIEEAQLQQIVQLIQSGRIQVLPEHGPPPPVK